MSMPTLRLPATATHRQDCSRLEPLQLRELLNSFAQASTDVPETLWTGQSCSESRRRSLHFEAVILDFAHKPRILLR